VGKDLCGLASGVCEGGEFVGRAVEGAGGTLSEAGYGVAQELAFVVHTRQYSARSLVIM